MNENRLFEEYQEPKEHIWPDIKDWPIYKLYQRRSDFVSSINDYTIAHFQQLEGDELLGIINKTMYQEQNRMKREPWKVDPPNEKLFWKKINSELAQAAPLEDPKQKKEVYLEVLSKVINRYSEEIAGDFKLKTFLFARKFLTFFFGRLLNAAASKGIPRLWGTKHRLQERLHTIGYVDHVRSLFDHGTVVLVPTHFSNLDSILIGYVLDLVGGMPAFHYGAGLNLYNSEFAAYFMNRLGAYRLDRRKKNRIYMSTLKSMSSISLAQGVNTIFFPGGTRSRSGRLEDKLKLGLLSTCLDAQRLILEKGRSDKIFVVPVVLNYHFVLEAKYLIEQHLRREGREKYIRSSTDKSKSIRNIIRFIYRLFSAENEIITSFGKPMDVFGNEVSEEGISVDKQGNAIDISEYFMRNGMIVKDEQRESIYTKTLGEKIALQYKKENLVLSSHLLAFTAFKRLELSYPDLDIYGLLRMPEEDFSITVEQFKNDLYVIIQQLFELSKEGALHLPKGFHLDVETIMWEGIKRLGQYHAEQPLVIKKGMVFSQNFKILYYYHNRLDAYGLKLK